MVSYIPERSDIIWLDFEPQKGKEIKKTRPAIVISPFEYNKKTGLALFMPITSKIKNYPFEIIIDIKEIKGAILADQIRSFDWRARSVKKIGSLPNVEFMKAISLIHLLIV